LGVCLFATMKVAMPGHLEWIELVRDPSRDRVLKEDFLVAGMSVSRCERQAAAMMLHDRLDMCRIARPVMARLLAEVIRSQQLPCAS
jgi:hypothetical protein